MNDPSPPVIQTLIRLSSFSFGHLLLSLFSSKKAQVEAKKEHEGAVRLLEVRSVPLLSARGWGTLGRVALIPARNNR